MVGHTNRKEWAVRCFIVLQFLIFSSLPPAFAKQESTRLPWSFLEHHRTPILLLASEDEALAFFQSTTNTKTEGSRIRQKSHWLPTHLQLTAEIKEAITSYLAALAATAHAQKLREILVSPTGPIPPSSDIIPGEAQIHWIMEHSPLQKLKPVMTFYPAVSAWSNAKISHLPPPGDDFAKFASYFDQTYQDWDESPLSWTSIFKEHGHKGIEDRFLEYWQISNHPANQDTSSPPTHDAFAQHYIETRLLPMFRATLLTHIIQLEAVANATAWESWQKIQQWQQEEQNTLGITRLCGTWRWIVHNHQNHGDRKMTVTFSPPDQASPALVAPTTIEIHGDTVYLQWTFPQGAQEDSLLLSNNDTHLEGTFKNSLGPHGSISGKRLSKCQS